MVEDVFNHVRTADMFVFFAPKNDRGWLEDRRDYSTYFATESSVDSSTHSSTNPSNKFFQTVWDGASEDSDSASTRTPFCH